MESFPKRAKLTSNPAAKSPKALYKQANKLIKQHKCCNNTDAEAERALEACIAALQQGAAAADGAASNTNSSSSGTPVTHGYDLDADDPQYLLAAAHCTLGQLLSKQGRLQEAGQHLEAAVKLFPGYVAARLALADVLLQQATTTQQLQLVEQHLVTAVNSAQQLSQVDKGLLLDANAVCRAEAAAGEVARGRLALLLCQQGRGPEADEHLVALGFCYRLSDEVLQYPVPPSSAADAQASPPSTPPPGAPAGGGMSPTHEANGTAGNTSEGGGSAGHLIAAVDNALPPALLQHMQRGFAPEAPFWREHNYGRVGYFSYMWNLQEAPRNSWQQLALHVQSVARKYFPAVAEARFAELWAHCRRHPSGHQLHFDSDDEGSGGVRNPIISTVLYLAAEAPLAAAAAAPPAITPAAGVRECHGLGADQDVQPPAAAGAGGGGGDLVQLQAVQSCVGGPTLMTDQLLGGPLATRGWLAFPATNRLTMFDARYLHGVLPGRGPSPAADGRRITVMIAFWRDVACRPAEDGQPGPTMPLPQEGCGRQCTWPGSFGVRAEGWGTSSPTPAQTVPVLPVWQPLSPEGQAKAAAMYDRCFQGF